MSYDPSRQHRRSIRLRTYDYSAPGGYFITVCVAGRECRFGEVVDGVIALNEAGKIVEAEWHDAVRCYDGVRSEAYVVMPNHLHAVVVFTAPVGAIHELPLPPTDGTCTVRAIHELPQPPAGVAPAVGAIHELPQPPAEVAPAVGAIHELPLRRRMGLGLLVGRFKMRSARRINALRGVEGVPLWQRNYYEHVIRDEQECQQCCEYILNNPGRWSEDHEHPDRWSPRLGAERT